jgi:hypothetical protein
VPVVCRGDKPVPVDLSATFQQPGGRKICTVHRNVGVWKGGTRAIEVRVNAPGKLVQVVLGGVHDADTDPGNNVWKPVILKQADTLDVHPPSP